MTQLVSVQRQIRSTDRAQPAEPQFSEPARYNQDTYLSDIRIQMDARFSAYGAIEVKIDRISIFRQTQRGAFTQNKSITIPTGNTVLPIRRMVEIWIWNPHTADPISVGISYAYGIEPLLPSDIGEQRPLLELNQELSEEVGGLDPETKQLLDELEKTKANILTQRITVNQEQLTNLVDAAITAITQPEPHLDSIRDRIQEILNLLGDQQIAGDLAGMRAQIAGILEAINNNDIEINTDDLEELLDDIKDKTVPDDFGITDGLELTSAPVPPAASQSLVRIKSALNGLLDGFNLQELGSAIKTLTTEIGNLEKTTGVDETIIQQFKLIRLRLQNQAETIPNAKTVDSAALFPKQLYGPGTHTNVINSKGHSHFIASMVEYMAPGTTIKEIARAGRLTPRFIPSTSDPDNYLQMDQASYEMSIDFDTGNSVIEKVLVWRGRYMPYPTIRNTGITIKVEKSNDIKFTTKEQIHLNQSNSLTRENFNSGVHTERYYRITYTWTPPTRPDGSPLLFTQYTIDQYGIDDRPIMTFTDVADRNHLGGTAYLSFEFQDSFGDWYPVLTSRELGTVSEHGDPPRVVRFSEARFGFPLPASSSIFRARLDVVGGSIGIGVGLVLLS